MTAPLPSCRHWREPRHRRAAICGSVNLAGSRLVTPEFCALCPFCEAPEFGSADDAIHAGMRTEVLVEQLAGPPRVWPAG